MGTEGSPPRGGLGLILQDLRDMLRYRELVVLSFAVLVSMIGFGLVVPFIGVYAKDFGASDFEIGLMVGVWALARLVSSPVAGWLADRVGRKPSMVFGMFLYCVVMVLFGFARNITELYIYRGLQGVSSGLIWPVALAYVGDVVPEKDRSKAMALYAIMFAIGSAVGPILGGIISESYSLETAFFVTAAIALVSTILLQLMVKESHQGTTRKEGRPNIVSILRDFRPKSLSSDPETFFGVCIGGFAVSFVLAALYTMLPLYVEDDLGLGNWHIGIIFALMGFVQMLVMFPAGSVADRVGKKQLIVTGCLMVGLSALAVVVSENFYVLLVVTVFYALGRSLAQPLFPAIISSLTSKENRGKGMGLFTLAQNLAFAAGSIGSGYISEAMGRSYSFQLAALVALLGAVVIVVTVNEHRVRSGSLV